MTQPGDSDVLPRHVVLPVGRGQHHGFRTGELEDRPLERRQPGWVEVLGDFHDGSDIEPLQPPVQVDQRAVDQLDARRLPLGKPVELEPVTGHLQASDRHVHADDLSSSDSPTK